LPINKSLLKFAREKEAQMKLTTARRKFKNQWMAFKIEREKPVVEGFVLGTAKTRDGISDLVDRKGLKNVYLTFNGPVVPRGVGFFF
jgi:hypothetical protein